MPLMLWALGGVSQRRRSGPGVCPLAREAMVMELLLLCCNVTPLLSGSALFIVRLGTKKSSAAVWWACSDCLAQVLGPLELPQLPSDPPNISTCASRALSLCGQSAVPGCKGLGSSSTAPYPGRSVTAWLHPLWFVVWLHTGEG